MIHILIPENFNFALFRKAFLCVTGISLISTTKKISVWVRLVLVAITSESTDRFTSGTAVIWSVPGNILFQGSPRRKLRYQSYQAWHPATRYPKINNQIKKCKACADRNESARFLLAGVTLFLIDLLTFSFCWLWTLYKSKTTREVFICLHYSTTSFLLIIIVNIIHIYVLRSSFSFINGRIWRTVIICWFINIIDLRYWK